MVSGAWSPAGGGTEYVANVRAGCTSLYMDGNNPVIAYSDYSQGYKAVVRRFDGSSWVLVGSAGFTATAATYLSLACDESLETPMFYLAYSGPNFSGLRVMAHTGYGAGSGWQDTGTQPLTGLKAVLPRLIISGGEKYIGYLDSYTTGSLRATVRKLSGNTWELLGERYFKGWWPNNHGFSFELINGIPHVSSLELKDRVVSMSVMKYDCYTYIPPTPTPTNTACVNLDRDFGEEGLVLDSNPEIVVGDESGSASVIDSAGRIVVAGSTSIDAVKSCLMVWRYDSDGQPDITFGEDGKHYRPHCRHSKLL